MFMIFASVPSGAVELPRLPLRAPHLFLNSHCLPWGVRGVATQRVQLPLYLPLYACPLYIHTRNYLFTSHSTPALSTFTRGITSLPPTLHLPSLHSHEELPPVLRHPSLHSHEELPLYLPLYACPLYIHTRKLLLTSEC